MTDKTITKRLSRDTSYTRPKKTYQEKLSPKEIKEKLLEYVQVDDITTVPLNTHIRYFTFNKKTGERLFRLGGFLTRKEPSDPYVILSNGTSSWSVQKGNSVFFKKMTIKDLRNEYEDEIKRLTKENKKLKETLSKVESKIKENKSSKKKSSKNSK